MGTNCNHTNSYKCCSNPPSPTPHSSVLAWRKGCDHDAALWLLLQGLMRRFGGLRAAFSLRFFSFFYTAFVTSSAICPLPPPPPTSILDILSNQCNDLNLLFCICTWSKHVRLRKRPINNQIFLPPWPLAVLSRIRVIRANGAIHLKWLPVGLIMSENP